MHDDEFHDPHLDATLGIVATDSIDSALKLALKVTEEWLETQGWDRGNSMYILASIPGMGMELLECPQFNTTICLDPSRMLPLLVKALGNPAAGEAYSSGRSALRSVLPEHFSGLMLFVESWCVKTLVDDPEANANIVEESRNGRLHQHPDREEMRMGIISTVDGRLLYVQRFRGQEAQEPIEESGVYEGQSANHTGLIPSNLYKFVQICAEVAPSISVLS
jgi:hypothetical protein